MNKIEIEDSYQNFNRYTTQKGKAYYISAQADAVRGATIKPLVVVPFSNDEIPAERLKAVLDDSVGGVIVAVTNTDQYWTSGALLTDLNDPKNKNPHYSYRIMTSVWKKEPVGHTVPQLRITTEFIRNQIVTQLDKAKHAGVTKIEHTDQDLIDQIEWTLTSADSGITRPLDRYSIADVDLRGDYTSPIPVMTFPANTVGGFDEGTWSSYMAGIKARVKGLNDDFVRLVNTFTNAMPLSSIIKPYATTPNLDGDSEDSEQPTDGFGGMAQVPVEHIPYATVGRVTENVVEINAEITMQSQLTTKTSKLIVNEEASINAALLASIAETIRLIAQKQFDQAGNNTSITDTPTTTMTTTTAMNPSLMNNLNNVRAKIIS